MCYICVWAGRRMILWAGRRLSHGPEGIVQWTGRSGPGKAYVRKVYIGELTKLRAYVVYVMLFQVLTVTRDGNGSIVHTEERVVFWRILVIYSNENGTMFCNTNMNKILNKCFNIKLII